MRIDIISYSAPNCISPELYCLPEVLQGPDCVCAEGGELPSRTTTKDAAYWIRMLALEAHPEGGYYRQTYRADLTLVQGTLPPQFTGPRPASTAIYFLLEGEDFSAFHRLRS